MKLWRSVAEPTSPLTLRSSGTCATDAAIRSLRSAFVTSSPARVMVPSLHGRRPVMHSASTSCPLPATPTTPRISPPRRSKETSSTRVRSWSRTVRPSMPSTTGPSGDAWTTVRGRSSRPTIRVPSSRGEVSPVRIERTRRPSRRIVTRSETSITSSSLWVMIAIAVPWSARPRMIAEEALDLLARQQGRGLVEHEHAQAPAHLALEQRLHDLQAQLLPDRHVVDQDLRVERQAVPLTEDVDPGGGLRQRHPAALLRPHHAQQHVLGHGQRRHRHQVLVDHADPSVDGLARAEPRHLLAIDLHRPGVGAHRAEDDVHQGALPGAVLAEEGVDLAAEELQIDGVVGGHRVEALGDAGEPQGGNGSLRSHPRCGLRAHVDRSVGAGRRVTRWWWCRSSRR